jgi:hypothetical protein
MQGGTCHNYQNDKKTLTLFFWSGIIALEVLPDA